MNGEQRSNKNTKERKRSNQCAPKRREILEATTMRGQSLQLRGEPNPAGERRAGRKDGKNSLPILPLTFGFSLTISFSSFKLTRREILEAATMCGQGFQLRSKPNRTIERPAHEERKDANVITTGDDRVCALIIND